MNFTLNRSVPWSEYDTNVLTFMTFLYVPLCVSSNLSNLTLILAIVLTKSLQNSTHILIFNSCLIDIYYSAVHLPIQLSMFWTGRETVSCRNLNYSISVFSFLSAYFGIVIALNRCVTICFSARYSQRVFSMKATVGYCILLWILSFVQNYPSYYHSSSFPVFNIYQRCCETKHAAGGKTFTSLAGLCGTALLVCSFYFILFLYVKHKKSVVEKYLGGGQLVNALKITKLTFKLFTCYIILLIPQATLLAFDPNRELNPIYFNLTYFVCMLDPLLTVIIYAGLNRRVRNLIRRKILKLNSTSVKMMPVRWAVNKQNTLTFRPIRSKY